ncbi:hypothetical protein HDU93_010096, partial [Gonapodya sp. JEL0774]
EAPNLSAVEAVLIQTYQRMVYLEAMGTDARSALQELSKLKYELDTSRKQNEILRHERWEYQQKAIELETQLRMLKESLWPRGWKEEPEDGMGIVDRKVASAGSVTAKQSEKTFDSEFSDSLNHSIPRMGLVGISARQQFYRKTRYQDPDMQTCHLERRTTHSLDQASVSVGLLRVDLVVQRDPLFPAANGIPFVFVHGLRIPSSAYKSLLTMLAAKGFRVLTYDLYGRSYSDAPNATYTDSFYVAQLRLLLAHVVPQWKRFNLAGLSLGGRIVAGFAALYGDMLNSLVLMCPALFLKPIPMEAGAPPPPLGAVPQNAPGYKEQMAATETILVQQKHLLGFGRAIYSTLTNWHPDPDNSSGGHLELTTISQRFPSLPVLAVWGTKDIVVPFAIVDKIRSRIQGLEVFAEDGHGHEVGLSSAKNCAERIANFVEKAITKAAL